MKVKDAALKKGREVISNGTEARENLVLPSLLTVILSFIFLAVLRYGLEGLITFKEECIFDAEKYEVTIPASASGLGKGESPF